MMVFGHANPQAYMAARGADVATMIEDKIDGKNENGDRIHMAKTLAELKIATENSKRKRAMSEVEQRYEANWKTVNDLKASGDSRRLREYSGQFADAADKATMCEDRDHYVGICNLLMGMADELEGKPAGTSNYYNAREPRGDMGTVINGSSNGVTQPLGNDAIPGNRSDLGGMKPTGPTFQNSDGSRFRAFRSNERIGGELAEGEVGNTIRNLWTGGIRNDANFGDSDPAGGYLLPGPQSGRLLDLARSASVVSRAGAITIPMDNRTLDITTIESDPSTAWRAELQPIPASEPTFGRIRLEAKTLAAICRISVELVEDSANAQRVIEQLVASAIAAEIDRAALLGSGTGAEPRGIINASGINTIDSVGTPSDYSDIAAGVQKLYEANYLGSPDDLAMVYSPATAAVYNGLQASDNQPLRPDPWSGAVSKYQTTKIGNDTAVLGDFGHLAIGMRTGLRIRVLQSGSVTDSAGTTWEVSERLGLLIVAHARVDVACLRPSFFSVLSGITQT